MCNDRPIHTRPFDYEAAKSGAPVALECGFPLTIHKWDCNNSGRPIVGIYGTDDRIGAWHIDGSCAMVPHSRLGLLMAPIGYLDGKPVFMGDKVVSDTGLICDAFPEMTLPGSWSWPAPPKVYPVTAIPDAELYFINSSGPGPGAIDDLRYNANIALRHFIDNLAPLAEDCALRAKLVELGWTPPITLNIKGMP